MNAVVGVPIARESDGLGHTAEKLSYASINWIRFRGSPSRAISPRPLASQPPAGAPLAGAKVVRVTPQVNRPGAPWQPAMSSAVRAARA
jgi:hypothetical protein